MKKAIVVVAFVATITAAVFGVGWIMHVGRSKPKPSEIPTESSIKYKVPEVKETGLVLNTEEDLTVSDQMILDTFDTQILEFCDEAFGEHVESLRQLYKLIEDAGYEYVTPYPTDSETVIIEPGMLEFNVYLPGARARARITKSGDAYETSFRFLEDGECETSMYVEDEDV